MAWPRPSFRWKRGACSSHLICVKEQLVIVLGDARFDLQINNIPRGSEDTVYGNGLFSEVQNPTYIVQGLLID